MKLPVKSSGDDIMNSMAPNAPEFVASPIFFIEMYISRVERDISSDVENTNALSMDPKYPLIGTKICPSHTIPGGLSGLT